MARSSSCRDSGWMRPAEMTSLVPSSTEIGSSITFERGRRKKKPVVGLGAQGMNTETQSCALPPGKRRSIDGLGSAEMNTTDHAPSGNSTRPTFRNEVPDWEKMVENTCLSAL